MATDTATSVPTYAPARATSVMPWPRRRTTRYPAARIAPREGEPPQMPVWEPPGRDPITTVTGAGPGHIGPSSVTATAGTAECRRRRATRIGTFGADPAGRPSTAHPGQITADDRASPAV